MGVTVTIEELIVWLEANTTHVCDFMDYDLIGDPVAKWEDWLDAWFGSRGWRDMGHRLVLLGQDYTDGRFAAWVRADAPGSCPIVFFSSEGGSGVLCASGEKWVQILAHAPTIVEYERGDRAAHVSDEENWCLDEGWNPTRAAEARDSLAYYREVLRASFGHLPPLDELTTGLDELNRAFASWIEAVVSGAPKRVQPMGSL